MNIQNDLKELLSQIEDLNTLSQLEESIELMKNIVMEDKNISIQTKKKYIFIYLQCMQYLAIHKIKVSQAGYNSYIKKAWRKIFGKKI